jgi:signal transduction histidine kinase
MPLEFDIRKLSHWLSVFAMLCRVLALAYGLVLIRFHPHPVLAARADRLIELWWVALGYTFVLIASLAMGHDDVLREPPFLVLDTGVCVGLLILAGGGHRNVFALYSWVPILTTALSLLGSNSLVKRSLLLALIVSILTAGFALSMVLDGYTFDVVLERREIDEAFLRTSSYPVLGLVLGFVSFVMEMWQQSLERMNVLRAQAAVEAERKRIAMDIHDSVLSQLTALVRRTEYAEVLMSDDPADAQAEMTHVATMAGDIHADIRWIVKALRQDPTRISLSEVIEGIVTRFRRNTGLPVDLRLPEDDLAVPFDTVRQMGYVVEETLANVWKHSRCTRAWVSLDLPSPPTPLPGGEGSRPSPPTPLPEGEGRTGRAILRVRDDGVGFDVGQVTGRSAELAGVGLVSIRERAVQMGGEARFISQPGQGTEVIVEIPLRDAWRQGIRESGNR